jgi:hypothetical protein
MQVVGWQNAIREVTSCKELSSLTNDFLASWTPQEICRLPLACRPRRMRGVEDIHYWRALIEDSYCSGAALGDEHQAYIAMLAFFSSASRRALELTGQREDREEQGADLSEAAPVSSESSPAESRSSDA